MSKTEALIFSIMILGVLWHLHNLCKHEYRATKRGIEGENEVIKILSSLPKSQYILLNNLLIPGILSQTTQIDHVLVSIYGIFVIETKNRSGIIKGKDADEKWKQILNGKTYYFYNPLRQNFRHKQALEKLLEEQYPSLLASGIPIISLIVFTERGDIKKVKTQFKVCNTSNLLQQIKKDNTAIISTYKMKKTAEILETNNMSSVTNNLKHIHQVKKYQKKNKK